MTFVNKLIVVFISFLSILNMTVGVIHVFKQDGGLKSIADFKNFQTCEPEVVYFISQIGKLQITIGILYFIVVYFSKQNISFLINFELVRHFINILFLLSRFKSLEKVAPNAPGRFRSYLDFSIFLICFILMKISQKSKEKKIE
jgi:hypothetical protein